MTVDLTGRRVRIENGPLTGVVLRLRGEGLALVLIGEERVTLPVSLLAVAE